MFTSLIKSRKEKTERRRFGVEEGENIAQNYKTSRRRIRRKRRVEEKLYSWGLAICVLIVLPSDYDVC